MLIPYYLRWKLKSQTSVEVVWSILKYHKVSNNISPFIHIKNLGTLPNIARNCIINVAETVVYDAAKEGLIASGYFIDGVPCHFSAAVLAGFCATLMASPIDVIKTR